MCNWLTHAWNGILFFVCFLWCISYTFSLKFSFLILILLLVYWTFFFYLSFFFFIACYYFFTISIVSIFWVWCHVRNEFVTQYLCTEFSFSFWVLYLKFIVWNSIEKWMVQFWINCFHFVFPQVWKSPSGIIPIGLPHHRHHLDNSSCHRAVQMIWMQHCWKQIMAKKRLNENCSAVSKDFRWNRCRCQSQTSWAQLMWHTCIQLQKLHPTTNACHHVWHHYHLPQP